MSSPRPFLHRLPALPDSARLAQHAARARYPVWLDGDGGVTPRGAMSYLTWNPHRVLLAYGDQLVEERWDPGRGIIATSCATGDPLRALEAALAAEARPGGTPPGVPWASGAVLALGFELADWIERLPPVHGHRTEARIPDLAAAFYDSVLVLDEAHDRAFVAGREPRRGRPISGVMTTLRGNDVAAAVEAAAMAEPPVDLPAMTSPLTDLAPGAGDGPSPAYRSAIARIRDHLVAGDIYQVNLSRALRAPWSAPPLALFLAHRRHGRVPHGAYLDLGSVAVLSFSPERFLSRRGDHLETAPIKGTRPRGADPAADHVELERLRASAKDRAEHVMIVDLERNDLGRVSIPGTVRVDPLFAVESYPAVHHLVSTVHAIARPGTGTVDLIRATFPGGSITGAPKIRAIEILRELEGEPRRFYTGAVGYWDAGGDLDLAITIRTATIAAGEVEYRVGGGIVIDSDADSEYAETCDKARQFAQVLAAFQTADTPAPVRPQAVEGAR